MNGILRENTPNQPIGRICNRMAYSVTCDGEGGGYSLLVSCIRMPICSYPPMVIRVVSFIVATNIITLKMALNSMAGYEILDTSGI